MRAVALVLVVLIVAACADVRRGAPAHARRNSGPRDKYVPWSVRDALPSTAVVPLQYPLYQQCDPIWGGDFMNGNQTFDTVCAQGCAMSSVSMAMHGKGYGIFGYIPLYPGTLNAWLHNNQGYVCVDGDCDNLVLDAPNRIVPGRVSFISEVEKPTYATMKANIIASNPVMIAHVRNNTHFVLVVGYDTVNQTTLYVNDPFYPSISYDYSEMSDLLLYTMK